MARPFIASCLWPDDGSVPEQKLVAKEKQKYVIFLAGVTEELKKHNTVYFTT
jgi:hypothetical protein